MKNFKKLIRKEEGFTLVELIVVTIIMGILAQIGLVSFNRYTRRTQAFAAKTALRNIKTECESNQDLDSEEIFTSINLNGYSLLPEGSVSCYGDPETGLISAIPNEVDKNHIFYYRHSTGTIITALMAEPEPEHDPYLDPIHGDKCTKFRTSIYRGDGKTIMTGCYGDPGTGPKGEVSNCLTRKSADRTYFT